MTDTKTESPTASGVATGSAVCPICGHLQPSGTFKTHPLEKPPLKRFRVQSERDGRTLNHGDYDTLEMARASACGSDAVILAREPNSVVSANSVDASKPNLGTPPA